MTLTAAEPILNDVLIALHRSLLQYMVDAWPWTNNETAARRQPLASEAASQAETVEGLAELLRERSFPVAFGTYPDFSNLNYLSLDFLLTRIVANQKTVVAACEAAAGLLEAFPEDAELVREIARSEAERLEHLKLLASGKGVPDAPQPASTAH